MRRNIASPQWNRLGTRALREARHAMLALSYATGLGIAELGARWVLGRWGNYYAYAPFERAQLELGAGLVSPSRTTVRMEINCLGERADPPPHPTEKAFRALVVGGSAAECRFLDQNATWSAVAQRLLGTAEHLVSLGVRRVHVGNTSRSILRCEDLAVLLAKILPRYAQLDMIVLMVGGADVVSWVESGMPPALTASPPNLDKIFEEHPEGPWGWRPSETALWYLARGLRRRTLRPVSRGRSADWLPRLRRLRAETPARLDAVPDPAPMLDGVEKGLGRLLSVARTRTERIVLVRQPWFGPTPTKEEEALFWNFGLGRPYKEPVSSYLTPRAVDALMRAMDARVSAVAASAGVEQVDTLATLERSRRTFYDELHLTPEGAEEVGRLAVEGILASVRRRPLHRGS
ncbi:MAG: hypothetical protein ACRENE_18405 [Polyangiaceae bacterium]